MPSKFNTFARILLLSAICFAVVIAARAQLLMERAPEHIVDNDPLKFIATNSFNGSLIYPARISVKGGPQRQPFYIVTRQTGKAQKSSKLLQTVPDIPNSVFDPQFSPDGKRLLVKSGWPYDRHGTYHLHIWDQGKDKIVPRPKEAISYRNVYWSPDGNSIAYIVGGDFEGNIWGRENHLSLRVYNLLTRKSVTIFDGLEITGISWTARGTLLFTAQPPNINTKSGNFATSEDSIPDVWWRLTIYEVSLSNSTRTALTSDAYAPNFKFNAPIPVPSPDNRWIAFLGWGKPQQQTVDANKPVSNADQQERLGVCLYNRATKQHFLLFPTTMDTEDFLRWTPDSKSILIMKTKYAWGKGEAAVYIVNIETRQNRLLSTIHAKDFQVIDRNKVERQFKMLQVSKDASKIFVGTEEVTGTEEIFYLVSDSLKAIDLRTGNVSLVARFEGNGADIFGFDWIDNTAPVTTPNDTSPSHLK